MNKLVIVGSGITGLAAAYLAARAGVRVTVLEASPAVGGLLGTFEVGGNRLEWFYHHAFTHDAELRWLLRKLGVEDRLEFWPGTMGVYRGGQAYAFNAPGDLLRFKPMSLGDKMRFALTSLYLARWAKWRDYEHVPAQDWFGRHAGRRATECIWEPLLRVKFGPYAHEIPLAWMIGRLRQRLNSRRGAREQLGYVRGSLQVLLEALLRAFERQGVVVRTSQPVLGMTAHQGEVTALLTAAGPIEADAFLFTIPTTNLAELVQPVSEPYAAQLRAIEYFGAVCTILELKRPLSATYWLNIADPGLPFGGLIEHTNLVPAQAYQGRHIVYLSKYFAASDEVASLRPAAIEQLMLNGLRRMHPDLIEEDLLRVQVFSARCAAVVCDLNFSRKVPACRAPLRRLFVAGMPHIYPDERSCNNSIRVAAEACRVMGLETPPVPRGASLAGQINMR